MCVVSMITDYYREKWEPLVPVVPNYPILPYIPWGGIGGGTSPIPWQQQIVPDPPKIDPKEIEEFKRLLERAREYDARNNEPACELQEKKDALLKIAKALGIEINFL